MADLIAQLELMSDDEIRRAMMSPSDPVGMWFRRVGADAEQAAKQLASGQMVSLTAGKELNVQSGNYINSFRSDLKDQPRPHIELSNTADYAIVLERGMQPKEPGGLPSAWPTYGLVSWVDKTGNRVFRMSRETHRPQVKQHPGISAYRILEAAAAVAIRENL